MLFLLQKQTVNEVTPFRGGSKGTDEHVGIEMPEIHIDGGRRGESALRDTDSQIYSS